MPVASAVGVHERRLDAVLAARPDLAEPLLSLLADAAGQEADAEIARLRADDIERFRSCSRSSRPPTTSSPKGAA